MSIGHEGEAEHLQHAVNHAAHYLPAQGPIGVFIHHNTLHAFQHLPFERAVVEAAQLFKTEAFLSEEQYRQELQRGRILAEDIDAVLDAEADAAIWGRALTQRKLRRAMLLPGVRHFSPESIEWQIEEESLLDKLREDLSVDVRQSVLGDNSESTATRALFAACFRRVPSLEPTEPQRPARPRDALLSLTGTDTDETINTWMIRLCAAFLDQGLAYWPMPWREDGFYPAVSKMMRQPVTLKPELLVGLRRELKRQEEAGMTATDVVLDCLKRFNLAPDEWESFLTAELLALPGWAGLMRRLEEDPSLAPHEHVPCSLTDFLAVRLTLTKMATENLWKRHQLDGSPWKRWQWPIEPPPVTEAQQMTEVARVFDVAQLLGLSAGQLNSLSTGEFQRWHDAINSFHDLERRRFWHLAYERRHEHLILEPLQKYRQEVNPARGEIRPAAQVVFCIDEREESIRRALEEFDPDVETLGAAGFFGVAVNYQGLDDPHGVALCPVVVTPQHAVIEKPVSSDEQLHKQRQSLRKTWANLAHNGYVGSRTMLRGGIGTMGLGMLSLFPLVTRVLAPRTAGRLRGWLEERLLPEPRTELTLMSRNEAGHDKIEGLLVGFSVREKAERVAGVLRPAGLVENLSRIVVILGHGSTSLNNPHESAHDCGACGGRRGGPNARLFAAMANHPQVRELLPELGINIPPDTWFVGGYHDTCNDDVIFFDEDAIPASHQTDFSRISRSLDRARAANALERSRRFEAAWKDITPEAALRHVQERAEHLAEPRPEYGHATNAVAIVGRRSLTRGLFLDRRAFLISYDPTLDEKNDRLAALLGAAGPVCAGINLEYYFSFVDNERYGCGTKLPHNVTGLVGVMNGHAGDLRTGLPWQMVEVHEPVRLLLIVETTPERVMQAVRQSTVVTELVEKRWTRVVTMDPADGRMHVYRNGEFEAFDHAAEKLPQAISSADWFLGKLEHLPIARIAPQTVAQVF